jgi:uncharacterized protein YndB with AHSA1/START domain
MREAATDRPVEPIRRSVTVSCAPERAFEVFTARMTTWWPHGSHSRAAMEFDDDADVKTESIEFQGRVGGRVVEHMSDGRTLPWAEILVWEPPHRFVMAWRPHSRPQPPTDVEVTFAAVAGGTEVVLEHRGWERLTEDYADLYASYGGGWIGTLGHFAEAANREAA